MIKKVYTAFYAVLSLLCGSLMLKIDLTTTLLLSGWCFIGVFLSATLLAVLSANDFERLCGNRNAGFNFIFFMLFALLSGVGGVAMVRSASIYGGVVFAVIAIITFGKAIANGRKMEYGKK